jgi:hypothetical protein
VKLKEQLNVLGHAYNPSYAEGIGRRIMLWGYAGQKAQDFIWKITEAKKGWSCDSSGEAIA